MQISLSPYGNLRVEDDGRYSAEIPATPAGLTYLKSMLLSRQLGSVKLGQPGAPTQAQIDAAVAAFFTAKAADLPDIDTTELDI